MKWKEMSFCGTAEELNISHDKIGVFSVKRGREIIVDAVPHVEESLLRLMTLGPAFSILLHQLGLSVFHASVIAFPSGAAAFFAKSGYGKSTLAAVLHARGHGLVADDVMALDDNGDNLMVSPSLPYFKLWPDSAVAIGEDLQLLPLLYTNF
jgi:hypothetical protein